MLGSRRIPVMMCLWNWTLDNHTVKRQQNEVQPSSPKWDVPTRSASRPPPHIWATSGCATCCPRRRSKMIFWKSFWQYLCPTKEELRCQVAKYSPPPFFRYAIFLRNSLIRKEKFEVWKTSEKSGNTTSFFYTSASRNSKTGRQIKVCSA